MDSLRVIWWCIRNPKEVWGWMYTAWAVENYYEHRERAMKLALERHRAKNPKFN